MIAGLKQQLVVILLLGASACSSAAASQRPVAASHPSVVVHVDSVPSAATATAAEAAPVESIELPLALEGEVTAAGFTLTLDTRGGRFFNGKRVVDDAELTASLRRELAAQPELRLVVQIDASVPYGAAVELLDLAKTAGVKNIALAAAPNSRAVLPSTGPAATAGLRASAASAQIKTRAKLRRPFSCLFPAAADVAKIDAATVPLLIEVDATGRVSSVRALRDPGAGFAQAALSCAKRLSFVPASGLDGSRVADRVRLHVRFQR